MEKGGGTGTAKKWRKSAEQEQNAPDGVRVSADVLHSGYAWKKGLKRRNWKRRFFVLTLDHLRYYTYGGDLKGEIAAGSINGVIAAEADGSPQSGEVASNASEMELQITTPTRIYRMVVESEQERQEWLRWMPGPDGTSALFSRVRDSDIDAVRKMLKCGIDVSIQEEQSGLTPLLCAASLPPTLRSAEMMRLLLAEAPDDPKIFVAKTVDERNCFHCACQSGNAEALDLLHSRIAELDGDLLPGMLEASDSRGRTLLHCAARQPHVAVVEWLISKDVVDVTATCAAGQTALHVAARYGRLAICRLLQQSGTSLGTLDANMDTAMDLAVTNSHMLLGGWLRAQSTVRRVTTPWLQSILCRLAVYSDVCDELLGQPELPSDDVVDWQTCLEQVIQMSEPEGFEGLPEDSKKFARQAVTANVLLAWAREELLRINQAGGEESEAEVYASVLQRLIAAKHLMVQCMALLPTLDVWEGEAEAGGSAVREVERRGWEAEGLKATENLAEALAATEAFYLMSVSVVSIVRRYNPRYCLPTDQEGQEAQMTDLSDGHSHTMLTLMAGIHKGSAVAVKEGVLLLKDCRDGIAAEIAECQPLAGAEVSLSGESGELLACAELPCMPDSFLSFSKGLTWAQKMADVTEKVMARLVAATLKMISSDVPCGFAVALMGEGGIGASQPFSQPKLLLIVEGEEHLAWFRVFAQLMQFKVLQMGESAVKIPGLEDVCVVGFGVAFMGGIEIQGVSHVSWLSPCLLGTASSLAQLQALDPLSNAQGLLSDARSVRFIYGTEPDFVPVYEDAVSACLSQGPSPTLRQSQAFGTLKMLCAQQVGMEQAIGSLSCLSPCWRVIDLLPLTSFTVEVLGVLCSALGHDNVPVGDRIVLLKAKGVVKDDAASRLSALLEHLFALLFSYQLTTGMRSASVAVMQGSEDSQWFSEPRDGSAHDVLRRPPGAIRCLPYCLQRLTCELLTIKASLELAIHSLLLCNPGLTEPLATLDLPLGEAEVEGRIRLGLFSSAEQLACARSASDPYAGLQLAKCQLAQLNWASASATLESLSLSSLPSHQAMEAGLARATVHHQSGNWMEAVKTLEGALEGADELSGTVLHTHLAVMFAEARQVTVAREHYASALATAPLVFGVDSLQLAALHLIGGFLLPGDSYTTLQHVATCERIASAIVSWSHPILVGCMHLRALVHMAEGEEEAAERVLLRTRAAIERWCGSQAPAVYAELLRALGGVALRPCNGEIPLGQHALTALSDACSVLRTALDDNFDMALEVDLAVTLGHLGAAQLQMVGESKDLLSTAIATLVEASELLAASPLGESHHHVVDTFSSLGKAHCFAKDSATGIPFLQKVLELRKDSYGKESEPVVRALNDLGTALLGAKELEKAVAYHKVAVKVARKLCGPKSRQAVASMDGLAVALHSCGKHEAAVELFKECLAAVSEEPQDQDAMASFHFKIGSALSRGGDGEAGMEELEKSLHHRIQLYGEQHKLVAASLQKMGEISAEREHRAEAIGFFDRCLCILIAIDGEESLKVASVLEKLSEVHWDEKNLDECRKCGETALRLRSAILGSDHPVVAVSLHQLAVVCEERGEVDEAEELHLRSMAIWKARYGEDHPLVSKGIAAIKQLGRKRRYRSLVVNQPL